MPSRSPAQHNLMEACDHGADYPSCPPKKVAHEFVEADKANPHHYARGGVVARSSGGHFKSRIPDECK